MCEASVTFFQETLFREFNSCDHLFLGGETGSGKTLAYAIPIMTQLKNWLENGTPQKGE